MFDFHPSQIKLKNAMVPKMTPMAQTNTILGIVYGLVNDKQFA